MQQREGSDSRPDIASLILVHGAGSGPWVYDSWRSCFEGITVGCPDLHAGQSVARASMWDYAQAVADTAATLAAPIALCGWSMGGLVALMAAARVRPQSLILVEPSPPAEVQGFKPDVELREGSFDPEVVYGPFPSHVGSRPESEYARRERKRGISVPSVLCSCLVIYGNEFPEDRGRRIARLYGADEMSFPDLDHWGLVVDPRVPDAIASHVRAGRSHATLGESDLR